MTWPQGAFTAQRRPLLPRQLKVIVNHTPPTLHAITLSHHTHPFTDLSFPPFLLCFPLELILSHLQVAALYSDVVLLFSGLRKVQ